MEIGKRIKDLRILLDLTQEELASRCELTKGFISQLENDLVEPSLSTLEDIVNALGTNLSDFFLDENNNEKIVFKKDDYFEKITSSYSLTWLVNNSQKNEMEPVLVTLQPCSETEVDHPHEGQEFGYIIEGELVLCIDKNKYRVKKGECFYFDSNKNHYLKNVKDKICKVIWVSSPPNF
ncbi:MAG: helix-turn-helix domain-containing protein [Bacilli bacterium]